MGCQASDGISPNEQNVISPNGHSEVNISQLIRRPQEASKAQKDSPIKAVPPDKENTLLIHHPQEASKAQKDSPIKAVPPDKENTLQMIRSPQKIPTTENISHVQENSPTQKIANMKEISITQIASPENSSLSPQIDPPAYVHPPAQNISPALINQPQDIPQKQIPSEFGAAVKHLISGYSIIKEIMNLLGAVPHSEDQLTYVVNALIDNILLLEQQESPQEKKRVQQLFTEEKREQIKAEKLYFHALQEEFLKAEKQKGFKSTKVESISRIYHTIANIKKDKLIAEKKENKFGIVCWKQNRYNIIAETSFQNIIKYQAVGHYTEKFGTVFNFKYNSIRQESNNIKRLLLQCFKKHQKAIQSLKFSLSEEEIMEVAFISRDACNYYDNGIYLILVYFVTSCKRLENANQSLKSIEEKMQRALDIVSAKYPPGEGLREEQKQYKEALENLAYKDKFAHQPQQLLPQGKPKQEQAEEIITNYAKIAKSNREHFEELVRSTCLKKCLETHIGLKYNPDNPNQKALTRIKQKMFFKKDAVIKRQLKSSIKQTLSSEETAYKLSIDQNLEKMTEIKFSISDMVRGKCTFLEITDIIETINNIKSFVRDDPQKRFRITEIESRFTNPIPISDVTLKIAIREEIVAELQLTIQTNSAAYNFAHKIYELQRTKVFSKVKISHNYFEQYQKQFKELVKQTLELGRGSSQDTSQSERTFSLETENAIDSYFDLHNIKKKGFQQMCEKVLFEKLKEAKNIPKFSVCTLDYMQSLMLPIFNKQMGKWYKELGNAINLILKQYKYVNRNASLLYFFFRSFNLSKELPKLIQFHLVSKQAQRPSQYFIEDYFKELFGITDIYSYRSLLPKLYHILIQFFQIQFQQTFTQAVNLRLKSFVQDVIVEELSPQRVRELKQLVNCFFSIKDLKGHVYNQSFQLYYNWLISILQKQPKLNTGVIASEVKLLMAQKLLIEGQASKARKILEQARDNFKSKEEHLKAMYSQLLLVECKLKQEKLPLEEFKEYYEKEIKRKALTLGLQLQGYAVVNTERRIAEQLYKNSQLKSEKRYILQVHYKKVITELSKYEAGGLIVKMNFIWSQFKELDVEEPQLIPNQKIQNINICYQNVYKDVCAAIPKAGWKNLTTLNLDNNRFGSEGCAYLSTGDWQNLNYLNLDHNNIGDEGCKHIIKGDWKNITTLLLSSNRIGPKGCAYLSKGDWKNLTKLFLDDNIIGADGCAYLIEGDWKKIDRLCIRSNNIGDGGCAVLIKADWKNMKSLNLDDNNIGDEGCAVLNKADWKNIEYLRMDHNKMSKQTYQQLKKTFGLQ